MRYLHAKLERKNFSPFPPHLSGTLEYHRTMVPSPLEGDVMGRGGVKEHWNRRTSSRLIGQSMAMLDM